MAYFLVKLKAYMSVSLLKKGATAYVFQKNILIEFLRVTASLL